MLELIAKVHIYFIVLFHLTALSSMPLSMCHAKACSLSHFCLVLLRSSHLLLANDMGRIVNAVLIDSLCLVLIASLTHTQIPGSVRGFFSPV